LKAFYAILAKFPFVFRIFSFPFKNYFIFFPNEAKNDKQNFVFYVFPAPDYPLITID
jgi:hypothetical protein